MKEARKDILHYDIIKGHLTHYDKKKIHYSNANHILKLYIFYLIYEMYI